VYFPRVPGSAHPRTPPRVRFDSLQQEAFLNLWRTYDRLKMLEDELFARFGLTAQQYNTLRLLRAVHPETLPTLALAGRLVSRAPDITRLLDRLSDHALVVRERQAPNRRTVQVRISDKGIALVNELADAVRDCHRRQLGHLSATELKQLTVLLRKVREPHEPTGRPWQ
jgi:DNA-binding MarR family transcriptional regulator